MQSAFYAAIAQWIPPRLLPLSFPFNETNENFMVTRCSFGSSEKKLTLFEVWAQICRSTLC